MKRRLLNGKKRSLDFDMNTELIGQIADMLLERKQNVSLAESCTGGLVQAQFAMQAGVSQVFLGGVVSYSIALKKTILGVDKQILHDFGAVSQECALEMAHGVRQLCASDWALSVTGIAGPESDASGQKVGTICFAIAASEGEWVWKHHFAETLERTVIQNAAARHLIQKFYKILDSSRS